MHLPGHTANTVNFGAVLKNQFTLVNMMKYTVFGMDMGAIFMLLFMLILTMIFTRLFYMQQNDSQGRSQVRQRFKTSFQTTTFYLSAEARVGGYHSLPETITMIFPSFRG